MECEINSVITFSWVDGDIEEANIESIEYKANFDWLEIMLITIFIILETVSTYRSAHGTVLVH